MTDETPSLQQFYHHEFKPALARLAALEAARGPSDGPDRIPMGAPAPTPASPVAAPVTAEDMVNLRVRYAIRELINEFDALNRRHKVLADAARNLVNGTKYVPCYGTSSQAVLDALEGADAAASNSTASTWI